MYLFDFIALSGAEQAKVLVMVIFGVIVSFLFSFFNNDKSKSKKENNKIQKNGNKLRTDGYYLSKYEALSVNNNMENSYFFIIFTRNGFVGLMEIEDINEWRKHNSDKNIKDIILETDKVKEVKNPEILVKYKLKDEKIEMKFYDPDENSNNDADNLLVYNKWYGEVVNDGLILSLDIAYFNNALQDYVIENQIKNLKFNFKKIDLN